MSFLPVEGQLLIIFVRSCALWVRTFFSRSKLHANESQRKPSGIDRQHPEGIFWRDDGAPIPAEGIVQCVE